MLVRLLDIEKDASVFREAWDWAQEAPLWFRDTLGVWKETFEEQMEAARQELHYGVFLDEEPTAVIRLIEAFPWVFNIHLSTQRRTPLEVLVEAGSLLRDFLFAQGVLGFYGFIPVQNRGVIRLYEALEFHDSGIRCFKGVTHGKVIEWKHMVAGVSADTKRLPLKLTSRDRPLAFYSTLIEIAAPADNCRRLSSTAKRNRLTNRQSSQTPKPT